MDELATGKVKPGAVQTPRAWLEAGELKLTTGGVVSSTYGTLDFLTPIAELPLTQVTQAEGEAYQRWRDAYQQNWRQFFDPIAIRFSVSPRRLSAEITVMPLIAGTDYRQFIALTRGSSIAPDSGDPHPETLLHLALAIHGQSEPIRAAGNFLGSVNPSLKANPLGWLGTNLCLQADARFFSAFQSLTRERYQAAQQLLCWNNLPVLNEWKRLYPLQDPIKFHERLWQTRLICPGGGAYVWNEKWRTMESTLYGHPGEPKAGPETLLPLAKVAGVNLGLSFENQGLSAKAVLDREPDKP